MFIENNVNGFSFNDNIDWSNGLIQEKAIKSCCSPNIKNNYVYTNLLKSFMNSILPRICNDNRYIVSIRNKDSLVEILTNDYSTYYEVQVFESFFYRHGLFCEDPLLIKIYFDNNLYKIDCYSGFYNPCILVGDAYRKILSLTGDIFYIHAINNSLINIYSNNYKHDAFIYKIQSDDIEYDSKNGILSIKTKILDNIFSIPKRGRVLLEYEHSFLHIFYSYCLGLERNNNFSCISCNLNIILICINGVVFTKILIKHNNNE